MKIAPLAEVKAKFSAYVDACQESPVVVTRKGKVVAMLIAMSDDDLDSAFIANDPRFIEIIRRGQRQIREGRGIPEDEFWQRAATPESEAKLKTKVQYPPTSKKARRGQSARGDNGQ